MTRAVWAAPALADLRRQIEYIEQFDPLAAQRMRNRIGDRAEWLADVPNAGARVGERRTRAFRVLCTPYTIVYRPYGDTILVLRIFHTRQNWR